MTTRTTQTEVMSPFNGMRYMPADGARKGCGTALSHGAEAHLCGLPAPLLRVLSKPVTEPDKVPFQAPQEFLLLFA